MKLWFTDTGGTGTPVVLLHANTGTSASWEPQAAAFVREGYRVIAFDRRGWGKSMADPATGPQPGSVAGDLDALADHLKLDKFHLVGVAGGGFVSLDYAAWRPERLRSLVVAGSTGQFSEKEMQDFTARIAIPELRKQAAVYREVGPSYRGVNPEGTKRWIEIEEHAQQPGAPSQPLRTPNTFAKLATVTMPILVMAADADLLAPPALMRTWAAHLKTTNGRRCRIPATRSPGSIPMFSTRRFWGSSNGIEGPRQQSRIAAWVSGVRGARSRSGGSGGIDSYAREGQRCRDGHGGVVGRTSIIGARAFDETKYPDLLACGASRSASGISGSDQASRPRPATAVHARVPGGLRG